MSVRPCHQYFLYCVWFSGVNSNILNFILVDFLNTMSARRARRSTRGRGRTTSFADPVGEPISDPPPVISPDPPAPTSTTVPPNPQPAADIDMSTLVRGASVPSTEPTTVADDALSRQLLQLLQGAVRASGAMPDPPIS